MLRKQGSALDTGGKGVGDRGGAAQSAFQNSFYSNRVRPHLFSFKYLFSILLSE